MIPHRLVAFLASAVLAGAVLVPAVPATAATVPYVPCPVVKVNPPPPSPSPMPTHDPALPAIGGEGMGATGMIVPDGSPALPTNLSATSWLVADLATASA